MIEEITDRLAARTWSAAQLTLDQFGVSTYEPRWDDVDEAMYFTAQVKDESDAKLAALHEYLVGDDARPGAHAAAPWAGTLPVHLFLSHIHQERHYIAKVKGALAQRGIDGFVAHDDIHPSQQWREVIKGALSSCHVFVAFLHAGFHESQWCDQEAGWALGRGVPVVTVRPPGTERRDGFLEEHQDISVAGMLQFESRLADAMLDVVVRDPRTQQLGVRALAEAFVNSRSFDGTRRLYGLLSAQDTIESDQLRRLEYAVQTNRQVYDAVLPRPPQPPRPIPELVEELVQRHEPPPPPSPWEEEPF